MKVIFLDIDGVLNSKWSKSYCGKYIGIDKDKVRRLAQIVQETDAKIVLSSTWRLGYNRFGKQIDQCGKYLKRKLDELHLTIYDVTPDYRHSARGREISSWIKDFEMIKGEKVEKFVILDDEDFGWWQYGLEENWVQTYWDKEDKQGLTEEKMLEAIKILQN